MASISSDQTSVRGSAVIDPTGRYRYHLVREWDPDARRVCFCLLNPSTADATIDDPTLRRCLGYARRWGFGSLEIINLFALRATDPRELKRESDPIGPDNDASIRRAARRAELIVAGWGNGGSLMGRGTSVIRLLETAAGVGNVKALGITRMRQPRHPLYAPGDVKLVTLEM